MRFFGVAIFGISRPKNFCISPLTNFLPHMYVYISSPQVKPEPNIFSFLRNFPTFFCFTFFTLKFSLPHSFLYFGKLSLVNAPLVYNWRLEATQFCVYTNE